MSKAYGPLLRHGARRNLPTKAGFSRAPGGTSRRNFLRTGTGLAAALLAPGLGGIAGCGSRGRQATRAQRFKPPQTVIVVGAGFGGLACADTLAHGGVNVIVLEATARAGGRVRTDRAFIPGDTVELGGEWIGTNHPTWLAYAQEFNLRLEEPGAAPEPEDAGTEPTQPTDAPGGTGPVQEVPRPEPFETEMELEPADDGQDREDGERARRANSDVRLVAFQDNAAPAEEQPAQPDAQPSEAPPEGTQEPSAGDPVKPAPGPDPAAPEQAEAAEPEEPIIINGKLVRGDAADKLYEEVDGVLARLIDLAKGVDPIRPWTGDNAAELDGRSFADFVKEQTLSDEARALLLSTEEADNGVPPERMSLLAYLSMVAGGGFQDYYENSETYRLADGNDALATALAQKLGARVRFDSAVEAVRRTQQGVIVRTRGGQVYRGDAMVLAVPPSVWRRIQFLPALDESLSPQMGSNVKLILKLGEAVWEKQGLTSEAVSIGFGEAGKQPVGLPREEGPEGALPEDAPGDPGPGQSPDKPDAAGEGAAGQGAMSEGQAGEPGREEVAKEDGATDVSQSDYVPGQGLPRQDVTDAAVLGRTGLLRGRGMEERWVGITWAASEPTGRGPVALTVFSGAAHAEAMRRREPARRNAWVLDSLEPAFPGLPQALIDGRFVDWPGFPLTRASYSFPAPGQVTKFGPVLVDGITGDNLPPLLFAGEHTSYGFIGYMEGALSSGVRAARMLLGTESRAVPEAAPAATAPAVTQPAETQPAETAPTDTAPPEAAPTDAAPTDAAPTDAAPAEEKPAETEPAPTEPAPEQEPVDQGALV